LFLQMLFSIQGISLKGVPEKRGWNETFVKTLIVNCNSWHLKNTFELIKAGGGEIVDYTAMGGLGCVGQKKLHITLTKISVNYEEIQKQFLFFGCWIRFKNGLECHHDRKGNF